MHGRTHINPNHLSTHFLILPIIMAQPQHPTIYSLGTSSQFLVNCTPTKSLGTHFHPHAGPAPKSATAAVLPVFPFALRPLSRPDISFLVVFSKNVHRPVVLHSPQIGRLPPPLSQLSFNISNCLPRRPLPCLATDPVHHRRAVTPRISTWIVSPSRGTPRTTGSKFICFFAGCACDLLRQVFSWVALSFLRGSQSLLPSWADTPSFPAPSSSPRQPTSP